MPALGIGQTLDTVITLASNGSRHRILLQRTPTADQTVGKNLPQQNGSGVIFSGGVIYDNLDVPISRTAGQTATLRVTYQDVQLAIPGDSTLYAVLLSLNGGSWVIQGSVSLTVDSTRPRFYSTASRAVNGDLLVLTLATQEDAHSLTLDTNLATITEVWTTLRGLGGTKAWLNRLAPETTTVSATVTDTAGNSNTRAVDVPERATRLPAHEISWNLPPWLPAALGLPTLDALHDAVEAAIGDIADVAGMLNPTLATGKWLDLHGRLAGVTRLPGESDAAFRTRVLAVPRNMHISRGALELHLTRIAGGAPVSIADATYGAAETFVRLDGTRRLDGTWQLGGLGTSEPPGSYLVRLDHNPATPLAWLLIELQRLRPMGMRPTVAWVREATLGIGRSLVGARDLNY
jgi:hypothetical protein